MLYTELASYSHANCLFVSDFDICVWLVDMDPNSLVPPFYEPGGEVIALMPEQHSGTNSLVVGEEHTISSPLSVQGRLKKRFTYWKNVLEASEFVLGIVCFGYRLPFIRFPPPVCMRNHHSALQNTAFVSESVSELLLANCIVECSDCPLICSPLQVVTNVRGKQHLVIDLRYVNQYLRQQKFKYEGLNVIPSLFKQGDFMITFDLKSGYHHVDIHQDCWQYLGFSWEDAVGGIHFYMFRVLPFGLSTACFVFTKLLRPLVKHWRSKGIRAVIYIDDGICASSTLQEAEECSAALQADLKDAGFVLNVNKSRLVPHNVGEWLGFVVDLESGCFRVPDGKIVRLKSSLSSILCPINVPKRAVASIVGQIMSMSLAVGPVASLRTRALYTVINSCLSWKAIVCLSEEAKLEIAFWRTMWLN